jgi:hypothetical protein
MLPPQAVVETVERQPGLLAVLLLLLLELRLR